ncbi:hypothetical protein SISNIDRAFT_464165 [Sistotremastrum niveocremeum HHB9708]|uniref:Myb-like domain-containing protein n=1 Tax=Sistotremastrum niveocremeum HHB9708 TaxID=1314777 RepID=A0A164XD83_9AGAM|nr:hypothetical protein SISNIDRAFT_464165 [Sistotremastrum niveocremeum HHB9708]
MSTRVEKGGNKFKPVARIRRKVDGGDLDSRAQSVGSTSVARASETPAPVPEIQPLAESQQTNANIPSLPQTSSLDPPKKPHGVQIVIGARPAPSPSPAAAPRPVQSSTTSQNVAPAPTASAQPISTSSATPLLPPGSRATPSDRPRSTDEVSPAVVPTPQRQSNNDESEDLTTSPSQRMTTPPPLLPLPEGADNTDGQDAEEGTKSSKKQKARKKKTSKGEPSTSKTRKKRKSAQAEGASETTDEPPKKKSKRQGSRKPSRSRSRSRGRAEGDKSSVDNSSDRETSGPRGRRDRRKKESLDTNLEPGEPVDPTIVTMKDLCKDLAVGRVSSRHIEVQHAHLEAKKAERERRHRIDVTREAKDKRGEDPDDPNGGPSHPVLPDLTEASGDGGEFDYGQTLRSNHFAPEMRLDATGEMVLNEESLQIDRAADPDIAAEEEGMVHVEETDQSRFVNSATHSRKTKGGRWSKEETELFYDVLRQFNTDFTMMSLTLPGRSARECRNKFNSEDRKNKGRVDWALANPLPIGE